MGCNPTRLAGRGIFVGGGHLRRGVIEPAGNSGKHCGDERTGREPVETNMTNRPYITMTPATRYFLETVCQIRIKKEYLIVTLP